VEEAVIIAFQNSRHPAGDLEVVGVRFKLI
jgi:hypothetical protein